MTRDELLAFMYRHKLKTKEFATLLGVRNGAVIFWLEGQRSVPPAVKRLMYLIDLDPTLIGHLEDYNISASASSVTT